MPKPYDHEELSEALDQGYNLSIERLAATVCDLLANSSPPPLDPDGPSDPQASDEPRPKRPYNRKPKEERGFDL